MSKIQLLPVYHPAIFSDPNYYQLLFPNPKSWLGDFNDEHSFFGLIAVQQEIPIGGIFGIHNQNNQSFHIHAWMVHHHYRGQGIGQRLLRTLETHLAKKNIQQIYLSYREEWASYTTLQHILTKQGWTPPKTSSTIYHLNLFTTLPNWVNALKPIASLEIAPWLTLTPAEQFEILNQNRDTQNPILQDTSKISVTTTFGMRYKHQLIGGLVSHHLRPDFLQYSVFWVKPEWQAKGYGYYLIQAALHAQQQSGIPQALLQIQYGHARIISSLDKYLKPLIQYKSTFKLSIKSWIYANRKEQAAKRRVNIYHSPNNDHSIQTIREMSA